MGNESALQDGSHFMGMLFYPGKPVGKGGGHEIMGSGRHSGSRYPHQHDFALEGLRRRLSRKHIRARGVGEGLVCPVIVEEHHTLGVGGDFLLAHLDRLADAHGNVPSGHSRGGSGDLQAEGRIILSGILDNQWIPADLPIRIGKDVNVPEGFGPCADLRDGHEDFYAGKGREFQKFLGIIEEQQRSIHNLRGDFRLLPLPPEFPQGKIKRIKDISSFLGHFSQKTIAAGRSFCFAGKKDNIEGNDFGPRFVQGLNQLSDLCSWPGPAPNLGDGRVINGHDRHAFGSRGKAPNSEAKVVEFALGHLEKFQRKEKKYGHQESHSQPKNRVQSRAFLRRVSLSDPHKHLSSVGQRNSRSTRPCWRLEV